MPTFLYPLYKNLLSVVVTDLPDAGDDADSETETFGLSTLYKR